ncbi:MAG: PDZ domain-containing protein, partial [candidate division Zixibacteria bacterium]|nr:PDZ domain-containing protein [candidate division Zixibacteria bacterium]
LKKFKVIFDYPRYRMILEKNTNYHLGDRYNTSGIQLIQDDKKILVYQVIKNSPAEEAKIKKDDEILSINQISVFNYSLQKIKEILSQEEGTEIELELKRKAKTKKVKLILKELI